MINHNLYTQKLECGVTAVEICKRNSKLIANTFHHLLELKKTKQLSQYVSPNIVIHKNSEVLKYNAIKHYLNTLSTQYKFVQILPFQIMVVSNNYVVAKYVEKKIKLNGKVISTDFVSIFKISNYKIKRIWEVAHTQI